MEHANICWLTNDRMTLLVYKALPAVVSAWCDRVAISFIRCHDVSGNDTHVVRYCDDVTLRHEHFPKCFAVIETTEQRQHCVLTL